MTKIAYNAKFGGFSLSHEGILKYAELKGIKLFFTKEKSELFRHYYTSEDFIDENYFSHQNISRTDPALIATIEELEELANGRFATLKIRDVPSGTKYRIDEYDGSEEVMTIDDYEWETA